MRKGDLVKLKPDDPEIARILEWDGGDKEYMASRPCTDKEREEWRRQKTKAIEQAHAAGEDTFHLAFDDGGESRLPPQSVSIPLPIDRIYIVERARCRVRLGWGNATGGMVKILDTQSGESAYVSRKMLEVVKKDNNA